LKFLARAMAHMFGKRSTAPPMKSLSSLSTL
jgi:hypothetical protein